ncbi:SDR family oxidoreductase [Nocardia speluncae]|uniref:SDR family oxidoreductase n=1 Tax=Nocardia speluncae TaxID=419477 RepID=A0A846X6D6_9NOCA|nr:SDR family oxidoreductase [Nocardia speluncae]NKY31482.1 SDR family oxidoreductase [Nocardia speluncae]
MPGVAVVTGASRGVGRAIALELAELGYDIGVGYYSRTGAADAVVREIEHLGRSACALQVDTREPESCRAMVGRARRLGPIRAVVANATGFADSMPARTSTVDTPIETYTEMFTARVGSVLSLVEAAGGDLHDGGRIVAVTSTGTRRHVPGYAPVAVSMAATESVIRYLAVELGREGVTANIASGGVIDTEALSAVSSNPDRLKALVAKSTPLGRVGLAHDLARLVKFLCGDDGAWVNGQTVIADGGNLIA